MKKMKHWQKGSFTVEASILLPFIIFLYVGVLNLGIALYENSYYRKEEGTLKHIDTVKLFYEIQSLENLGEEIFSKNDAQ